MRRWKIRSATCVSISMNASLIVVYQESEPSTCLKLLAAVWSGRRSEDDPASEEED